MRVDLYEKPDIGAKPFLKWAGGKKQLIDEIESHLPQEIKDSSHIEKYFEPFIGGGAVFFHLNNYLDIDEAYISDINKELILTYNVIKNHPKKLIKRLKYISSYYKSKNDEERKHVLMVYLGLIKIMNLMFL